MNEPALLSIACANPARKLSQQRWIEIAKRIAPASVAEGVTTRLAQRSGIDTRWCAAADEQDYPAFYAVDEQAGGPTTSARMQLWAATARPLALQAGAQALVEANLNASRITHVVTASCTGFESPGVDQWLIEGLSLSPSCRRTHIGFMGCHAAVNALAVAQAFARADPKACVLVCCVEICSVHLHYGDRLDRLIANTLFADGVAAAVIACDAPTSAPRLTRCESVLIPDSVGEMAWSIGDHGFEMTLGAAVPDLLRQHVGRWVREMLSKDHIEVQVVGGWAIHPGGPRVIDSVLASLDVPAHAGHESREILREYGNMSSATLLFILRQFWKRGVPRPWVGLAFGPGLAGEMLLIQ